jgi:two-component system chemotaxis sensor kinase CheA
MTAQVQPTNPGLLRRIRDTLVLPPTLSAFEQAYLARMNRIALWFFWGHLPLLTALAWINDTGPLFAAALTLAVLAGPTVAYRSLRSPRAISMVFGFTAMCMGGVLVHVGQGPVQIEMHFYFFSVLAMLALFANPMVVLTAAATVSVHHLLLWFAAPKSVFNYDAPLWVVLVHAAFVVLETIAACFIARNFFDNVIGLEKKVEARTAEIAQRNRDMRLVLDNVRQGFLTVDAQCRLSSEHSRIVDTWFGGYEPGETFAQLLGRADAKLGAWFALSWESVTDGFLPLELALDQLPKRTRLGERHFAFDYQPIGDASGQLEKLLIVVSDVTSDVAKAESDAQQREILAVFERILNDRAGFLEFYEEAKRLAKASLASPAADWSATKRHIHTLKGNSALFGLEAIARQCHVVEERLAENDMPGVQTELAQLERRWSALSTTIDHLLGQQGRDVVTMSGEEYDGILRAVVDGAEHADIARKLVDLKLEPTEQRLGRFAEQARALAQRLEKGDIDVAVDGNGLRLERERFADFWSSFSHVLRNAIDHGIEPPAQREQSGKPARGRLELRTFEHAGEFVVEVRDDGRGIDWEAVRKKAEEQGLSAQTQEQLREALFCAGVSTAAQVSEVSGRGVGLAAVKDSCAHLGGAIDVRSESGRGTVMQFRFPLTAVAAHPLLTSSKN